MCCFMVVDLICPKCGSPVLWCNGGDVIYDFSSQFKATCPSCGYEDWAASCFILRQNIIDYER